MPPAEVVLDRAARLRADAITLLQAWEPPDAQAGAAQDRVLGYVSMHLDAPWRASSGGAHLTVSVVLADDAGRTLLTLHPKFGRWMQLGGHLEPEDHSIVAAAEREAREESGLTGVRVEPVLLDVGAFDHIRCPAGRMSAHLDLRFLARCSDRTDHVRSAESLDLRWWPLRDLPAPHDEDLDRLARLARARL